VGWCPGVNRHLLEQKKRWVNSAIGSAVAGDTAFLRESKISKQGIGYMGEPVALRKRTTPIKKIATEGKKVVVKRRIVPSIHFLQGEGDVKSEGPRS